MVGIPASIYERGIRMDAVEGRDAGITGMTESIYVSQPPHCNTALRGPQPHGYSQRAQGSPSYESRALEAIHYQVTEYGTRFDRLTFPERDIDNGEGYFEFYKHSPQRPHKLANGACVSVAFLQCASCRRTDVASTKSCRGDAAQPSSIRPNLQSEWSLGGYE